ncbi:MAG: D-glucuronyl C5-epimerase family protein [Clostridia bacterium]|nr:D-glucuronyl C5-epimerase family protein [Clostridia bacterium]
MGKGKFYVALKKRFMELFPRLAYWRVKRICYRSNAVINDLSVKKGVSIDYRSDGLYPTMFAKPPSHYASLNAARQYDAKGIPHKDSVYNPVSVIQYGLAEYGYYHTTRAEEHLERARAVCDWLLENQDAKTGCWYYQSDFHHKGTGDTLHSPWASAMAQGEGISLLMRVYGITKQEKYLKVARSALEMLEVPVSDGGLCAEFDGYKVYEEYPTDTPSFTLNGTLFCSFGLFDYAKLTGDEYVYKMWESQVDAVERMLPLYDDDVCSSYDLSYHTAGLIGKNQNEKYHLIHIALLQNLQSIAPRTTFEHYIRKWAKITGH